MRRLLALIALTLMVGSAAATHAADAGSPGQNTHRIAGIGVMLANDQPGSHRIHHFILIKAVQPHSPALEAGLQPGDEIVAIDDFRVAGQEIKEVVEGHLRGEQDSVVQITVKRPGQTAPLKISLIRKIIPVDPATQTLPPRLS